MAGFVKLHRAVRGTAIAQHPEYFAAWVHILCMATHKTRHQVVGTKIVDLEPGDLVFGRHKFSATTGISENKVRSALKVMTGLGMITSKSHAKFSVISITNWTKYQDQSPANNQQATSKPPASNHEQECIKNGLRMSKDKTPVSPVGDGVPFQKIIDLYHEHLPMLARVANITDTRKSAMRARWAQTVNVPHNKEVITMKCNTMDFWERYFLRAASQPFLVGDETKWAADFDFLIKKDNFIKVVEMKYIKEKS
jgi:hypothetical protein